MTDHLLELCMATLTAAERLGATEAEVVARRGRYASVVVERSAIKSSSGSEGIQLAIRAYVGKSMGLAFTTRADREAIEEMVSAANSLARSSQPDPNFEALPEPKPYPKVEGLYDKELANIEASKLIEMMLDGVHAAKQRPEINISGNATLGIEEEAIANTRGIQVMQEMTYIFGSIDAKITSGEDLGIGSDHFAARSLSKADFTKIGSEASRKAERNLGSESIDSGEYSIVLDQRTTNQTLSSIIGFGANAYTVMLGTSYFKNKLNQSIGSELINMVDNPLHPAGIASSIFDAEGFARQKTLIVKDGVLENFFSDSYTANKLKILNTGHASRPNLRSKPHPDLTNTQIGPGDSSLDELIQETRKGIYIYDSGIEPMAGTTNISSMVDFGFLIENGEIKHSVKNTMLGTTVFDLLKNIDMVSKELLDENGQISPSIRIRGIKVASGI
ncbi:MAG: TldD/PmbA family protein [Thermoproteota archaeon]